MTSTAQFVAIVRDWTWNAISESTQSVARKAQHLILPIPKTISNLYITIAIYLSRRRQCENILCLVMLTLVSREAGPERKEMNWRLVENNLRLPARLLLRMVYCEPPS